MSIKGDVQASTGSASDPELKRVHGGAAPEPGARWPEELRLLMDSLPYGVGFKDRQGRFTRINRGMATRLGLGEPAEGVGKSDFDFYAREYAEDARRIDEQVLATGEPVLETEERQILKDGRQAWVVTSRLPVRDRRGTGCGLVVLVRDFSDQLPTEKIARDARLRKTERTRTLSLKVFRKDRQGRFTFCSRGFCELLGLTSAEILNRTDHDFYPPELAKSYTEADQQVLETGEVFEAVEEHRPPGGETMFVRVVKLPLYDVSGRIVGIQGIFWDVTETTRAQRALAESEKRYALAVEGSRDGLWDWDVAAGKVHYSSRWKSLLGCADPEIGATLDAWLSRVHPEDLDGLKAALDGHLDRRSAHFENKHRIRHRDGSYRWVLSRGMALHDAAGRPLRMCGSLTDISDLKRAEDLLARQALHDPLTGLPNRTLFMSRLGNLVAAARRTPEDSFAVLFLDLDRFKDVNDSLGHDLGDRLLIEFSRRLEACIRPGDMAARLGGDEFAILLERSENAEVPALVAERILEKLRPPFDLDGHDVFSSASIGIALGTSMSRAEDLLRDADTAMYRAKEHGRACFQIFDASMHASAVSRLRLISDLRCALERGEFRVFFQPIVSSVTRRIDGVEALVRWQHPRRGLLPPSEFLPLAEETRLVVPMDLWVLAEACRQGRRWQRLFPSEPSLQIHVNLSSCHFQRPGLEAQVERCLRESGLRGSDLTLEITESVAMEDSAAVDAILDRIKALGVNLSLDDFGTGYSSLEYLNRRLFDGVKIPHTFVHRMGAEEDRSELVRAIVLLAGALRMSIVAEGVETPQQLARLEAMKCGRIQGYLFSKPLEAADLDAMLSRDVPLRSRDGL